VHNTKWIKPQNLAKLIRKKPMEEPRAKGKANSKPKDSDTGFGQEGKQEKEKMKKEKEDQKEKEEEKGESEKPISTVGEVRSSLNPHPLWKADGVPALSLCILARSCRGDGFMIPPGWTQVAYDFDIPGGMQNTKRIKPQNLAKLVRKEPNGGAEGQGQGQSLRHRTQVIMEGGWPALTILGHPGDESRRGHGFMIQLGRTQVAHDFDIPGADQGQGQSKAQGLGHRIRTGRKNRKNRRRKKEDQKEKEEEKGELEKPTSIVGEAGSSLDPHPSQTAWRAVSDALATDKAEIQKEVSTEQDAFKEVFTLADKNNSGTLDWGELPMRSRRNRIC